MAVPDERPDDLSKLSFFSLHTFYLTPGRRRFRARTLDLIEALQREASGLCHLSRQRDRFGVGAHAAWYRGPYFCRARRFFASCCAPNCSAREAFQS